jgi:hypothetical protein
MDVRPSDTGDVLVVRADCIVVEQTEARMVACLVSDPGQSSLQAVDFVGRVDEQAMERSA